MSTTCEFGLEPNLRPPAPRSRTGRSQQATYAGKPQGKTTNDKKSLNKALKTVLVNYALASLSRVPDRPKYYFSPHGTLPP
jgi:hypothetical protein